MRLGVAGFKAVRERIELEVRPLTLIAGTNSSGKSSFIQPFLLLKQTLESEFDPGPLLLNGPNVKLTSYTQAFSRGKAKKDTSGRITLSMEAQGDYRELTFVATAGAGFKIDNSVVTAFGERHRIKSKLAADVEADLRAAASNDTTLRRIFESLAQSKMRDDFGLRVGRSRCFLDVDAVIARQGSDDSSFGLGLTTSEQWRDMLRSLIHVPGLRGNPERSYPRSAVGETFPGRFETYLASIVHAWGKRRPAKRSFSSFQRICPPWIDVEGCGTPPRDASLELLVGRMPHAQQGGALDLVSVADVGFGVSQTLPVIVALIEARPGQIVYLEQPEIHLHPRAQIGLGDLLVAAAKRGVLVIAETHSSLLLRSIQTALARGDLAPSQVSMNWFSRDVANGFTMLTRQSWTKRVASVSGP